MQNSNKIITILVVVAIVAVGIWLLVPAVFNDASVEEEPEKEDISILGDIVGIEDRNLDATYLLLNEAEVETKIPAEEIFIHDFYLQNTLTDEVYYLAKDHCAQDEPFKLKLLEGANAKNFFVFEKDSRYATDMNNVFFNEAQGEMLLGCGFDRSVWTLENADYKTFEPKIETEFDVSSGNYYRGLYSRDAQNIYYGGEVLEGVDADSFRLTNTVSITMDKNNVYLQNEVIPEADPDTYEVVHDYSAASLGRIFGKDASHVFVDYCTLEGVDAQTFKFENRSPGWEAKKLSDKDGVFEIDVKFVEPNRPGDCSVIGR